MEVRPLPLRKGVPAFHLSFFGFSELHLKFVSQDILAAGCYGDNISTVQKQETLKMLNVHAICYQLWTLNYETFIFNKILYAFFFPYETRFDTNCANPDQRLVQKHFETVLQSLQEIHYLQHFKGYFHRVLLKKCFAFYPFLPNICLQLVTSKCLLSYGGSK